jgi:hypothetical protein
MTETATLCQPDQRVFMLVIHLDNTVLRVVLTCD